MAVFGDDVRVLMIGKPGSGKISAAHILFDSRDLLVDKGKPYTIGERFKLMILDLTEDINKFQKKNPALADFFNIGKQYVIFVLSLLNRITSTDEQIFQNFTTLFGEKYGNYVVLIFNDANILHDKKMKISEYIEHDGPPVLQRFVSQFNNRYFIIDKNCSRTNCRQDLWIKIQRKCEEGHVSSNLKTHKDEAVDEATLRLRQKYVPEKTLLEEVIELAQQLLLNDELQIKRSKEKPFIRGQICAVLQEEKQRLLSRITVCIMRLHGIQTEHAYHSIGIQTEHVYLSIGIQTEHANPSIGIQTEHANPSIGIQTEHANPSIGTQTKQAHTSTGIQTEHVHTSIGTQTEHAHTSVLPNISMTTDNIVRPVSQHCQADHPTGPTDMNFELNIEYISNQTSPEFVRDEVIVRNHRHLIFATNEQLRFLSTAKTLFIDCTIKIVSKPFIQLLSIHFFALHDDDMKQLPGVFVLLSRKKKKDYKKVLLRLLPILREAKRIVLDFESNLWKAVKYVFPDIQISGCAFHWRQSVWRHVQEIGLQDEYITTDSACKLIRKVLALPFLPAEQITETFNALNEKVNTEKLAKLMDYIRDTWIIGDIWDPTMWTVYRQSVRTDNDVEGWHNRINTTSNVQLYELIDLLFKEASLLPTELMMVTERSLLSYQKKNTLLQHRLFALWDQYKEHQISVNQLLKKCVEIYGDPVH